MLLNDTPVKKEDGIRIITKSQKGKHKILREVCIYVYKKELKNNIRSFECQLRRKGQCMASIKVDVGDQVINQVNEHKHPPSQTKCEMELVKNRIKNRLQTTFDTTQRIHTDKVQGISPTAAVNLPNAEHLRRRIRSQRHGAGDVMPEPVNRQAIPLLPMEYHQTSVDERFYLFESGGDDNDRIFVFGTNQALQLLANSDDWLGYGTYKVCPEVPFQLYTVHVKLAGSVLPCICALLPNKQGFTYARLF